MSYIIENNIIKCEDVNFDFAALGGLGNIIFNSMKKNGKNIAQIDPDSDRQDTYEYLWRQSIRTALMMKSKGINTGDLIMGCSNNHLDACLPIIAALFLGAIPCSMDPYSTIVEARHMLNQVRPKMVFTIPSSLEMIEDLCRELKLDAELVVFGNCERYTEFRVFLKEQVGENVFQPVISKDPKETAILYWSSGTSGLSKVCCLSHQHFIKQTALVATKVPDDLVDVERKNFEYNQFKRGGSCLVYSPLNWITGGRFLLECMFLGITRILAKRFDPEEFWNIVEKYRVLLVLIAPFHLLKLVEYGQPANVNVESLVKILTAGTPLKEKCWRKMRDLLPDTDIIQCYGLTETGITFSFDLYNKLHNEYQRTHPECVGFPVKGIWYKVVDLNTKKAVGPNQEGELLIKSPYFMNGYYNQSSEGVYDHEGWFLTGDVVYYTENCAFYVTDRLKEMLRFRQLTVFPCVIENILLEHPAVTEAVVIGIPHEVDGDRAAAFVVLNEDFKDISAEELRKFANERVQDQAKLRAGLWILKSIPTTFTGKVRRRELKRMILEEEYSKIKG